MPQEGLTPIQAKMEATRCLMCADAPCSCNCPAGVDARAFIRKIRFDNLDGAVRMLKGCNVLAASCSMICPTGTSCAKECTSKDLTRPIDISGLQRFVMDYERRAGMIEPAPTALDKKPVAVIGSGPAGLGCAAELAVRGHLVTVFEADSVLGGMPRQCIPSFRLPNEVVDFEIEFIRKLGVQFVCDKRVDNPKELLSREFGAVFVATGLNRSKAGGFVGDDRPGVYQALDFLRMAKRGELPELGKRVLTIGGGDTALDAARVARRTGCESFIIYRRTQNEMPAYPNEIEDAWHEGVEFYFRVLPRAVVGDDRATGLRCVRIRWHEALPKMARGYDIEGTEFVINCDTVVAAIGQEPESTFGLRAAPNGCVAVGKEDFMTSEGGIFAGGDLAMGGGTAAQAVGTGKQAAVKIDEYLNGGQPSAIS